MMLKIITTNPPTNNGAISKLEADIGKSLPMHYRAFLLSHNGGTPEPDTIDIDEAPIKATDVQVFHGVDDEIRSCDLRSCWETLDGCKENQILPIAHDSLGHSFGLILDEADYGQIYYFDSAEDPPRPYLVANDFNEFLGKLRKLTPKELAEIDALSAESETVEPVDISFPFTGSRPADAALGNAAVGYETTPRGYVWHRHQDGETLQLVPKDVHKQTGDPAGYALRWRPS